MKVSRRQLARGGIGGLFHWMAFSAPGRADTNGAIAIADGTFVATIVTPTRPSDIATYAAEELAIHLGKATGSRPAIIAEPADDQLRQHPMIYLGDTAFARHAGIMPAAMAPEASLIQTVGGHVCICGRDDDGAPLDLSQSAGTLFGVYDFLERFVGVRWLWPGDLGVHVPASKIISIPVGSYPSLPPMRQRHVRSAVDLKSDHPELGFSKQAEIDYFRAQSVFLRRHRMGKPGNAKYRHAFGKWWDKFGTTHPEWFQLVNDKRGPVKKGARYSMCISDPNFHAEIISQWRNQNAKRSKEIPLFINAVENDIPGLCECSVCRALDSPESADYRTSIPPKSRMASLPFVTDRYAKSWLEIQKLASAENPEATVVGYAYFNYFASPTSGVKLNSHVLIGFCPSGQYFPHSAEEQEWLKKQWRGWSQTGARVFMRANYFLDGYCMPYIFAHQFADEFQNAAQHSMFGTDFDSLTGHWATQGPNLYLLMRLHTHPHEAPDALLAEYYSGFGPAAPAVKAYFDYWEANTTEGRNAVKDAFESLDATRWRTWAKAAHAIYDEHSFTTGEELLAKALTAASADPQSSQRVKYLQLGLRHARLCVQVASKLTIANTTSTYEIGKQQLDALIAFRRANERSWISNLNHCSWVESKSWVLPVASSLTDEADQE
jgi:Domain of unknown function (DUF4838)